MLPAAATTGTAAALSVSEAMSKAISLGSVSRDAGRGKERPVACSKAAIQHAHDLSPPARILVPYIKVRTFAVQS